jgi:hypothetical protein
MRIRSAGPIRIRSRSSAWRVLWTEHGDLWPCSRFPVNSLVLSGSGVRAWRRESLDHAADRRVTCYYFLWDADFGPAFIKVCAFRAVSSPTSPVRPAVGRRNSLLPGRGVRQYH